jgi:hypothetical protein
MSSTLTNGKTNEKPKSAAPEAQNTTAPIAPKNQNAAPLLKKGPHKKSVPTISALNVPQVDPLPAIDLDPLAVPIEVEAQKDPAKKSGGLVDLLKTAKARAGINEDTSEDEEPKRSHKKGEGTGAKRGRPSNEDNREEFSTLVFTILTIVASFSGLPPEIRPEEEELKSLAYNIGGILARHLPALGKMSPDIVDLMGITGTLALWYQRAGPEVKRLQAEKNGMQVAGGPIAKKTNGSKPPVEEGPTDPISNLPGSSGDFLKHVHKGEENGND